MTQKNNIIQGIYELQVQQAIWYLTPIYIQSCDVYYSSCSFFINLVKVLPRGHWQWSSHEAGREYDNGKVRIQISCIN